jgi:hypothetical protein
MPVALVADAHACFLLIPSHLCHSDSITRPSPCSRASQPLTFFLFSSLYPGLVHCAALCQLGRRVCLSHQHSIPLSPPPHTHLAHIRVLDALVDSVVRMCITAAGEKDAALRRQAAPAPTWDRPVFVLNCLTYLVDMLAPYPCASCKREELEAWVLELIEEHVRFFPSCPFPYSAYFLTLGNS